MTFGERLKEFRKSNKISQKKLADLSGVSYSMVCKLESGSKSNPSLETIEKLSAALRINSSELFGLAKEQKEGENMGINDYIQVGSRIKEYRTKKGIKQKEIARKLGIPISTYANYENNHREPTLVVLDSIAKLLGVSTDYLLGLSPFKQPYSQETLEKFEKILKLKIELQKLINEVGDVP